MVGRMSCKFRFQSAARLFPLFTEHFFERDWLPVHLQHSGHRGHHTGQDIPRLVAGLDLESLALRLIPARILAGEQPAQRIVDRGLALAVPTGNDGILPIKANLPE